MPESAAGSVAFLNGEEIVNDGRTLTYLQSGYGPPTLQVTGACVCPQIRELIDCSTPPYATPTTDPAPWYDSSVPESADFAGFLTAEFQGLGSTYTRTNVDKITGGAVLGRLRPQARTLTWRGFLFGRSECAVRYGLAWMTANLKGSGCVCGGEELDLMICCPDLTATPPVSGCSNLPAIAKPASCPPFTEPDAFRTLKSVGLVDGPKILSQRRTGCSGGCGDSGCDEESLIMEIEFSLVAGNPFLFGCPVCLCVDQTFDFAPDCMDYWVKVLDSNSAPECAASACEEVTPCDQTDDHCQLATLPTIPAFEDNCFCEPVVPIQVCCPISADDFGQFFEAAPVIEIYSGSAPMRATTVRFFENLNALDCCDVSANSCLNCDNVQVTYIPRDSTLTIDGSTRTVTLLCPGSMDPIQAEHLTVTPFSWPLLSCSDFCICVETDGVTAASNASVTVSLVPREM